MKAGDELGSWNLSCDQLVLVCQRWVTMTFAHTRNECQWKLFPLFFGSLLSKVICFPHEQLILEIYVRIEIPYIF